jgi:CBS-domain-containing membrane protein
MSTRARDIMQSPVVSVSPEAPLIDVHRLFVDEEIHGAPVVRDDGVVVGSISMSDLVSAAMADEESGGLRAEYLREMLEFSSGGMRGASIDFQDRLQQVTAADVMAPGAATVQATAPVREVAEVMHKGRIHRVWVIERGSIVGVISSFDLLPLVAKADL